MLCLDITHAWKGTEYRSSLRKAERALRKAVLLGAMILVVLGIEIKGAEAGGPPYGPPYAYGDCDKATIGVGTADCAVDNYSGKVGVRATAFWGASAAQAQVGTAGNFNQSGYYVIWCDINYVAKFSKTSLAIATLHANLFADGVKYTDDFLGADPVWPWQLPSIWDLWSAPRNRSHWIVRKVFLGQGPHTIHCGLEARIAGSWNQSGGIVAVGDVTRINWSSW